MTGQIAEAGGVAGIAPAPWDADWWYSIVRDLHNQPGLDRGEDEGFSYPGWDGDNTANANLIAAAPELYEALENLAALVGGEPSLDHAERLNVSLVVSFHALAKARGEVR